MAKCLTCEYFGSKNGVEWCYHPLKNWSTRGIDTACGYYEKSKW